jgi:hypothetical protein
MYAINININLTKNASFVPFTTRGGGGMEILELKK